MTADITLLGTREVGSRSAARVEVVSTPEQPTRFAGRRGIVVDGRDPGNVFVRLALRPSRADARQRDVTLPFGVSNLVVVASETIR